MMADPEKAYQNGGVQKPIFAPVSQNHKLGDDIDLSDIFSDYLAAGNEYDDPLYAWGGTSVTTHGVTADGGGAPSVAALAAASLHPGSLEASAVSVGAQGQVAIANTIPGAQPVAMSGNVGLPTGGIRTAFHVATLPSASGNVSAVMPQDSQLHTPAAKKLKVEGQAAVPMQMQTPETAETHQRDASLAAAPPQAAIPAPSGAISGRLGFSMVGGRLAIPQRTSPTSEAAPTGAPMTSHENTVQQGGVAGQVGVQLPVGVGIRLGGVRGVVPTVPTQGAASLPGAKLASPAMSLPGFPPAGPMSDQALAERRQRNREHAKRSRVRKKFMLESLQQQVRSLQEENMGLRLLVQRKIPRHAQQIIADCCAKSPLFADVDDNGQEVPETGDKKEVQLVRSDFNLIRGLSSGQQNFVLSDPRLPDNPIVYASEGFYELTGYARDQVLGRNCRFLQGPGTDPRAVEVIRTAIANGADASTCLLNYRADGTPFWNQFFIAALRDAENCIVNYVGVQCEVEPETSSTALEEKVNAVLPLQGKEEE